jgi:hypothetical protein
MTAHPSAHRIDALAHGMLEREQVGPMLAHIAGCERCAALLRRRLSEADELRSIVRARVPHYRSALLPWAAAALALVAVASFLWTPPPRAAERRVGPASGVADGETFLTLRDGTQVLASPALRHVGWREVAAEAGEYYFDVARAEGMPFVVHTPAGEVRVVGTKFFLRVEDGPMNAKTGALAAIAVVSGAVILWNAVGTTEVGPSQTAVMERDAAPRRTDEEPVPGPVLAGESAQRRMAQLEAELRASRLRIEQLEAQAGTGAAAPALAVPRSRAQFQRTFFPRIDRRASVPASWLPAPRGRPSSLSSSFAPKCGPVRSASTPCAQFNLATIGSGMQ